MNTNHLQKAPEQAPRDSASWLGRAWTAVAMPVFFLVAFAVGEGLYALLGYQPENADAPAWVLLVTLAPTVAVVLIPLRSGAPVRQQGQERRRRPGNGPHRHRSDRRRRMAGAHDRLGSRQYRPAVRSQPVFGRSASARLVGPLCDYTELK